MCNQEEEQKADRKKAKLDILKEQEGVYVGETGRSIFERASEHVKDTETQKKLKRKGIRGES